MEIKDDLPEFDLDDILKEFHSAEGESSIASTTELDELLKEMSEVAKPKAEPSSPEAAPAGQTKENAAEAAPAAQPEAPAAAEEKPAAEESAAPETSAAPAAPEGEAAPAEPAAPAPEKTEAAEPAASEPAPEGYKPPIPFAPRTRIQELKRKLIAGPEKRYYDLSEVGLGKLQLALLGNLVILGLCVLAAAMFYMDKVPANRMKLLLFSQVLALLGSGLLGCHLMLDGLDDLFRLRFSLNTMLVFSFLACGADVYFCLQELRIPCCAAFCLAMEMALLARYHRRSTEMAQMDTLRKAVRLISIVKQPDYYDGKTGILRGEGDVEDFMDTYVIPSGPEKVQNVYAAVSLLLCVGIAVLAGLLHSVSMGVQILSTALLVAVPAGFFVAVTRPAAVLEKRLHMVGTVICGWRGVKKLCGKAVFPLTDEDLFPKGSTKLNGVKFYSDRDPDQVVAYMASLTDMAGGGLANLMRNMNKGRTGIIYPVTSFRDYGSGGIGGEVCGEPVLLGTMKFLQDMGVEIPQGTMVSQAVYAAIDGQLAAVAAISYTRMRSAAAGLLSLRSCRRVKPVLLAGDFMLTEEFIRSKFNVSSRKVAMPDKAVRAELAKKQPDPEAEVLALTTREDLISAAYAVSGARALRAANRVSVAINMIGGLLGMAMMLAIAYLGTTELLTPSNVLLYQLVWLVPGYLATSWTRIA